MKYIPGIDTEATGKRIGKIIDSYGIKDKELAKIMGVSVQAINKWRHGRNIPDIENLFALSKIFGVKVDDFLVQRKEADGEVFFSTFRRLKAYCICLMNESGSVKTIFKHQGLKW